MAEILTLPGGRKGAHDTTPDVEVIALIEQLLTDARSGSIQAIAIAGVRFSPGQPALATTAWEIGSGPHANTLLAAITVLQYRLLQVQCDWSEPAHVDEPS